MIEAQAHLRLRGERTIVTQLNPVGMGRLQAAADDPVAYARRWKSSRGGAVIGSFPMNFPAELVHAAGSLPVVVQDSATPITEGRSLLAEFYCNYTRSVADQVATGALDVFDGFVAADHCVQLLGAVDVIRWARPQTPVHFAQFTSAMDEPGTQPRVRDRIADLCVEIQEVTRTAVTAQALTASIGLYNENRRLLREFFTLRRSGRARITASQMQLLVKSSMVMDVSEHNAILGELLGELLSEVDGHGAHPGGLVRLHLSGHLCHAPRPELLDLIEECGAVVVDDDLYTGFRYITTDVATSGDPFVALSRWYLERNDNAPCPTRVSVRVDWDSYLLDSLAASGADGVVVLMVKFCEPHMLYYPELRKALEARGVPLQLIETDNQGLAVENLRTRLETFIERIRRQPALTLA